jgi:hypothetical protein
MSITSSESPRRLHTGNLTHRLPRGSGLPGVKSPTRTIVANDIRSLWTVDVRSLPEAARQTSSEEQDTGERGRFGSSRKKQAAPNLAGQLLVGHSIAIVIRHEAMLLQAESRQNCWRPHCSCPDE